MTSWRLAGGREGMRERLKGRPRGRGAGCAGEHRLHHPGLKTAAAKEAEEAFKRIARKRAKTG
jgi:hypothetical protein